MVSEALDVWEEVADGAESGPPAKVAKVEASALKCDLVEGKCTKTCWDSEVCEQAFAIADEWNCSNHTITKDEEWAAVKRHHGRDMPTDTKCLPCPSVAMKAYPEMPWTQQTLRARKVFKTRVRDALIPEQVSEMTAASCMMERRLLFLTAAEVEAKYGVKADDLEEITISTVLDKRGEQLKGIFMVHPEHPYREFMFRHSSGFELSQTMMGSKEQLRNGQGLD
eukprot:2967212-Amphidinium_carterae.1